MKKHLVVSLCFVAMSAFAQDSNFEQQRDKMWQAVDINNDGKISRQEALAKASEMFDRQDLNKDGFITKDEIKSQQQPKKKK